MYEVLLDLVQANSWCRNHLSPTVANRLQAEGKPCPMCQATPLKTVEDMFFKCKVRQLKVRCSNKSAGCEWVGELGELDNHLKPGSVEGPCHFVDVECPLQCGQCVTRRNLNHHKSNECARRLLYANIVVTSQLMKKLLINIGLNPSIIPRFAPTIVRGEITVELVNQKEGGDKCERKPVEHTDDQDVDNINIFQE